MTLAKRVRDLERKTEPKRATWRFIHLGADQTWSICSPDGLQTGQGPLPTELRKTDYITRSNIRDDCV